MQIILRERRAVLKRDALTPRIAGITRIFGGKLLDRSDKAEGLAPAPRMFHRLTEAAGLDHCPGHARP
jgi:hypothetical protein